MKILDIDVKYILLFLASKTFYAVDIWRCCYWFSSVINNFTRTWTWHIYM